MAFSGSSTTAETLDVSDENEFTIEGKDIKITDENKRTGELEVTYIPLNSVKKYFGIENVTQLKENPIGSLLIQAVRDPIGTFMTENRYYIGTELAYDLDSKTVLKDPFGNISFLSNLGIGLLLKLLHNLVSSFLDI